MAGIPGDIGKGKRGGYGAARSRPGSCGYLLLSRRARALVGEMPGNIEGFVFLVCESLTALGRAGCSSSAVHYEWAKKKVASVVAGEGDQRRSHRQWPWLRHPTLSVVKYY